MKKIKIIGILLLTSIIGCSCIFIKGGYTKVAQASNEDIKELDYKECTTENESGLQIDKYEKIQSTDFISDNEVVTLTKKGEVRNPNDFKNDSLKYCSIYNLDTKESKDFNDVNIDKFYGVSKDKQYALYSEYRDIPLVESDEWHKALETGEIFHQNIKVLNISAGEITDLATENNNKDAEYSWIDDNKIFINYWSKWSVVDVSGKVIEQGDYGTGSDVSNKLVDASSVKCSNNALEGKIYYTQRNHGKVGANIICMDMKTKNTTSIISGDNISDAYKKGSSIVVPYYENNGEANDKGVYENRTHGTYILDENGAKLQDIKIPKDIQYGVYTISPDGSKIAYLEDKKVTVDIVNKNTNKCSGILKVLDVKTGDIKEIINESDLEDKNTEDISNDYLTMKSKDENGNDKEHRIYPKHGISNLSWDKSGTSLLFTYCNSVVDSKYDSYIVSFD